MLSIDNVRLNMLSPTIMDINRSYIVYSVWGVRSSHFLKISNFDGKVVKKSFIFSLDDTV